MTEFEGWLSRETEVRREFARKDLRQQEDGIKRDGQTIPARDQCSVVGGAVDSARDATRRDPFGGIAGFDSFLGKIGFVEAVGQHMPVRWRSPNHIDPTST